MTWHRQGSTEPLLAEDSEHRDRYEKALADRAEAVTNMVRVLAGMTTIVVGIGVPAGGVVALARWLW